jgi:hypothetical protein
MVCTCQVWRFNIVQIFVIKYFKFCFLGISCKAILHKKEVGQVYYQDLFTRILTKFIL